MTNINIKIPDEVHKKLKVKCAIEGTSLKKAVIEIIKNKLKNEKDKFKG